MKQTNIKKAVLNKIKKGMIVSNTFDTESDFIDFLASKLALDVNMIIYKENNISSSEYVKIGRKIRQLCSIYDSIFIIYDRVDIAKIIDSDGIFLDSTSADIEDIIKIYDKDKFFGYLIQNLNDIQNLKNYDFDFLCLANKLNINDSNSKLFKLENGLFEPIREKYGNN